MAKFKFKLDTYDDRGGNLGFAESAFRGSAGFSELSCEELLSVLRPAAEHLRDAYVSTINRLFRRRTGSLAVSINLIEWGQSREYMDLNEVSIIVKPTGNHKTGMYTRKSRAGPADRKYAKHGRKPSAKALKNEELGYLLEVGTPRIAATHWMENTNEDVAEEIQDMIETEFDNLLRKKGLIE